MILLSLLCGFCASEIAQLQLVKTTFNHGRDVLTSGGTLVSLEATSAVISEMSIVSRVKGSLALIESVNSSIMVEKCAFEGLASYFGHFSGGSVSVASSSFVDSARPLTIEGVLVDSSVRGSIENRNLLACSRVTTSGAWSTASTTFDGCSSTDAGGAISYSGNSGSLSIKDCTFKNCKANKWGEAIYSKADIRSFVLDGCTFDTFTSTPTEIYSVVHFQRGNEGKGNFESLTLRGNTFKSIDIRRDQGGGSGLVVKSPTKLELI